MPEIISTTPRFNSPTCKKKKLEKKKKRKKKNYFMKLYLNLNLNIIIPSYMTSVRKLIIVHQAAK